ncbi:MAG TPA: hypothetical protein VF252_11215 [Gemmatimonadales bacterium]
MRHYWMRIVLGAVAIFAVGMIGISLVRRGLHGVHEVAEGTSPIRVPLAFVPFKLEGRNLGKLSKLVLYRSAPKQLSSVELEVKLADSVLARGLEGCRLVANLDDSKRPNGRRVEVGSLSTGVFSCLQGDDSTGQFQDFGRAIFQPGNVSVPLLLPRDMVNDLQQGNFDSGQDSAAALTEAQADSIADAVEAQAESISTVAERHVDSIMRRNERLLDSLRREGERRADSTRRSALRMADSARGR